MGGFTRRLHEVISPHTCCLPSGLGLLARKKAHMQAGEHQAWGGCCHGAWQGCRQGLDPCSPRVPLPHPHGMRGHGALQGSLQMAWKVVHRDQLPKTGGKDRWGHFCLAAEPGWEQGESDCPGKPSAALPCLETRGRDQHWRQLTLNNLLMIL